VEILPGHKDRLESVVEAADNAFWAVIAERFPKAKSGDYPPDLVFARIMHNREDVLWWLRYNAPQLLVGNSEVQAKSPEELLKPGVYESDYGNAISWDGQRAFDLDMGEEVPFNVIMPARFIRPLD